MSQRLSVDLPQPWRDLACRGGLPSSGLVSELCVSAASPGVHQNWSSAILISHLHQSKRRRAQQCPVQ